MFFRIQELKNRRIGGVDVIPEAYRPLVFISSNSEKNLPDPFLRRCIYYHIPFPDDEALGKILLGRLESLRPAGPKGDLLTDALAFFRKLYGADVAGHKLSPSELIQWLAYMLACGANPRKNLKYARECAEQGLSALVKDGDAKDAREQLKSHIGS